MKTAFHTGFLTDLPVIDAVSMVLDHGYDFVELNAETLPWQNPHVTPGTDAATRKALVRAASYSAISAHNANLGNPDPAVRKAALAWTTGLIDLAVDLECPVVHVIPGDNAVLRPLCESLARAVEYGATAGVSVALEPIVEQVIGTSTLALAVLDQVPGLFINFDPSHLQVTEHDVPLAAERLGPYTVHAALKDGSGEPGAWSFPALGDGEIPFDRMLAALSAAGFDGTISVEHEAHVFAGDTRGHGQVLAESRTYLDGLLLGLQTPPITTPR